METVLMYVFFVVGLVLIIEGGNWFVDSASWIAEAAGLPKFVIGATIVSIATTLPEIIVSITATVKGNVDMAAGNVIGSATVNTALILGVFILFIPFSIKRREIAPKGTMLLCAILALFLGCVFTEQQNQTFKDGEMPYYSLTTIGAIALLIIFIVYFAENFISMRRDSQESRLVDSAPKANEVEVNDGGDAIVKIQSTGKEWAKNIAIFVVGATCTVFGAQFLVDCGTYIATSLHVPQRIISVIAIAIGTSLPEIVTAINSIRKKVGAMSVGNVIGANIIDLTVILPICSFISLGSGSGQLAVSVSSVQIDMIVCFATTLIAIIPTIITKKFHRWQGAITVTGYIAYLIYTVFF